VTVQTIDPIDSRTNKVGERFRASLAEPIAVGNQVVIGKGADACLELEQVKSAGHFLGKSELEVNLISIDSLGKSFPVAANLFDVSGASRGKNSAEVMGAGAVVGGAIGALVHRGAGAAVGAGAGVGTAAVVQVRTKGKEIRILPETKIPFVLPQSVIISYVPTAQ
jgi:hypothetical protein